MVDFVRILARTVFAAQQRMIGEGLVRDHLDAFAASRLILRRLGHRVQLCHLVLKTKKNKQTIHSLVYICHTSYTEDLISTDYHTQQRRPNDVTNNKTCEHIILPEALTIVIDVHDS